MSLRQRTIIIISTTLFMLTAVLYLNARTILLQSFAHLEEEYLLRDIKLVNSAVDHTLAVLLTLNGDWSNWDDTYKFVHDLNADYVERNLLDQVFVDLRLNYMLFVDPSGELIFGKGFDLEQEVALPVAPDIVEALSSPQVASADSSGISGIVMVGNEALLVAAQPILNSESQGPARGSLVMARYVNAEVIADLSTSTHFTLSLYPFTSFQFPEDHFIVDAVLSEEMSAIQIVSEREIAGYGLLQDVAGAPALIFRIDMVREIYAQGQATLALFLVSLVGLGLAFTLVVLLLLERTVLARIQVLSDTVSHVQSSGDLGIQISVVGKDELARLATSFQNLLVNLGDYQTQLRQVNEHLEEQVALRVQELADTIVQLQDEIKARETIQAQLADARDEAVNASQIKSQILANISHDARTPLSVIVLRIEMLKRGHYGQLSEKQDQVLDGVLASTYEMLGFINNLLQGSKLDTTSQIIPNSSPITPDVWLDYFIQSVKPLADQKGLQLITEVTPDMPEILYTDPDWLKHIVTNLTNNAIKFTEKGSVRISIFKEDGLHWCIRVTDTGAGIPDAARAHIFEAFWQLNGSATRSVNRGVGLGLSIVQQLAKRLGGSVSVDSVLGQGSSFTVRLPLETEAQVFA